MSKITFRADDDLVEQLEELDASKSEAMREALRSYLEGSDEAAGGEDRSESDRVRTDVIDELIRTRVDDRLRELGIDRADSRARDPTPSPDPQDVNVSISLEGAAVQASERNSQSSGQRQTGARDPTPNDGEAAGARERAETQSPTDETADGSATSVVTDSTATTCTAPTVARRPPDDCSVSVATRSDPTGRSVPAAVVGRPRRMSSSPTVRSSDRCKTKIVTVDESFIVYAEHRVIRVRRIVLHSSKRREIARLRAVQT